MRKLLTTLLLLLFCLGLIWSCQKEIQSDPSNPSAPAAGTGGSGTTVTSAGWSFTGPSSAAYRGCIDTAFYERSGPLKILNIDGLDSAGNQFSIVLVALNGTFTATTYTPVQGALMVFTKASGQAYSSSSPTSFSFQVTAISDTAVTATFSATLSDPLGAGSFTIANGKLKALIGKHNTCPTTVTGGGGGSSGAFTLVSAAGDCFGADVQGTYRRNTALTAANKVILKVNATATGAWSLTTATANGFAFSGSNTFTFTGPQTITLQASGIPTVYGNTAFPISTGGTACSFSVPVDTLASAPCSPVNNSVTFSTAGIGNFTVSNTTTTAGGSSYKIVGNGLGGDISFEFAGTSQPVAGVYHVQPVGGSFLTGDVTVNIVASSIFWQSASGNVYVSVVNGKVVAVFCNVPFSGSLGGPSYNTLATAKITEQ